MNTANITIITNLKNWMEGLAIDQAKAVANLPHVENVYAMPDLHAGKTPIGVTVVTQDYIYPHLIGTDIGCGMAMFATGIEAKKIKLEKWVSRLNTIKTLSSVPNDEFFPDCPIPDFGTLGSGNHFAEFQTIQKVYREDALTALGISPIETCLTVHSGSRSYGSAILAEFADYGGYPLDSPQAKNYLKKHDDAMMWAARNRREVAEKLIRYLGFEPRLELRLECYHNFLEIAGQKAYHRKGTVSAKTGPVIIAGSRGTLSYLVNPTTKCADFGDSLAHGSGRKWARSMCKSRIKDRYDSFTIKQNQYNGRLVCHDLALTYEEAPEAYKNIENVIGILQDYGLIEVIASLKPVLTFKG